MIRRSAGERRRFKCPAAYYGLRWEARASWNAGADRSPASREILPNIRISGQRQGHSAPRSDCQCVCTRSESDKARSGSLVVDARSPRDTEAEAKAQRKSTSGASRPGSLIWSGGADGRCVGNVMHPNAFYRRRARQDDDDLTPTRPAPATAPHRHR